MKTPLEFVASAVRASGARGRRARAAGWHQLNNMGMPLYGMQPPTGYSMKADAWVNSSALLGRMNFALGLTSGKVRGVSIDATQLAQGCRATHRQTLARLEAGRCWQETSPSRRTIRSADADSKIQRSPSGDCDDPSRPPNVGVIAGLLLGSPEFQRR